MMTTMFDAPMQDFTGDSTMDADMLPSANADTDWLQVENMMDDGDAPHLLAEEVDMTHGDVEELEMRDAADAEFVDDLDQMSPETAEHHARAEPQDQEIPDASRAPSPGTLAFISNYRTTNTTAPSGELSEDPLSELEPRQKATQNPLPDSSTFHNFGHSDESSVQLPESTEDPSLPPEVHGSTVDTPGSPEPGDAAHSHPPAELSEPPGNDHVPEPSVDHGPVARADLRHSEQTVPEGDVNSRAGREAPHEAEEREDNQEHPLEEDEADDRPSHESGRDGEKYTENREHLLPESEIDGQPGHELGPGTEEHADNQVTQEEEESSFIDPPPSVLLSFPFDGSHFALFNLPEDAQVAHDAVASVPDPTFSAHSETKGESHANQTASSLAENVPESETPILLFRERFGLYYEPLSLVFEALRASEAINIGGRFDHNIELVFSAPELDLTLPEDNINAREVSLHDLGVLHTGCDLPGLLSLRLDTISPRFGTRYRAIRDEIVRVASQQDEEDQASHFDATNETYTDESEVQEGVETGSNHDRPDQEWRSDEKHHQSLENRTEGGERDPHEGDTPITHDLGVQEAAEAEDGASGEYGDYAPYDEVVADEGTEDLYEDAEGEYVEDEEDAYETGYEEAYHVEPGPSSGLQPTPREHHSEDAEALNGAHYQTHNHTLDPDSPLPEVTVKQDVTSPSVAVEDVTDSHKSTSEVIDHQLVVPEQDNVSEITSHENFLPIETYSDAEHLLSETPVRSRSDTPHVISGNEPGHDEVIAYEDTVEDGDDEELPTLQALPTTSGIGDKRGVSTSSKRSYDEHELDQLDGVDPQHDAEFNDIKRLRVD